MRRVLTADEAQACAAFRSSLEQSAKTQEVVGEECGVTQGMVWQWASGKRAIPATRAAAAAKSVGAAPEEISVQWREKVTQSVQTASFSIRRTHKDPDIAEVVQLMESVDAHGRAMILGAVRAAVSLIPQPARANGAQ